MNAGMAGRLVIAVAGVLLAVRWPAPRAPAAAPVRAQVLGTAGLRWSRPLVRRAAAKAGGTTQNCRAVEADRRSEEGNGRHHARASGEADRSAANLEKAELAMEPLMSADQPNDAAIVAQIDKVVQARGDLERANARFLLAIRTS